MGRGRVPSRADQLKVRGAVAQLGAALLVALGVAGASGAQSVDVVYVEANVGGSSGGHIAARFDDRVYHFQNREGSWLRLERASWAWFRYAYGVLQNRDLVLHRVPADDAGVQALRDGFDDRYLLERRHFDTLEALDADLALFERSRDARVGAWSVRGGGYFCRAATPTGSAAWRTRVSPAVLHPTLARRAAQVDTALRDLALRAVDGAEAALRQGRGLALATPSERYGELVQQRLALDLLLGRRDTALCPGAFRIATGVAGRLEEGDRAWIASTALALERRAAALLRSPRPDWGDPLLLALARREALAESLRRGRFVVLDAFARDASSVPGASLRDDARRPFLAEIEADVAAQRDRALRALRAIPEYDERRFNDWEDALNRALELERGIRSGHDVRVSGERLVPEGWGAVPALTRPTAPSPADLEAAREARVAYRAALERRYGYDLLGRNCATELLRGLDTPEAATVLGGRIDPDAGMHFVPRVAFRATGERYRGVVRDALPSYRARRLAQMRRDEGALRVFARESNTLSSTVYRRNPRDSWFVFFTDDAPWVRPLFGLANLAAGAGETGVGLLSAPFDRGARLRSGLSGMVFSAPELVFVNLRKGTLEYGRAASETPPAAPPS